MECRMERRFHRGFTAAEKTELWDRWKHGESLKAIGRAFGKPSSSIYFLVAPRGGFRPAERRRSRLALTLAEREVICRGVTAHQSARSMAKLLGRSLSLSQLKSEHIGGVARRELGDKECVRPVRRRARPARPSPRIDACVPHYNISGKTAVRDGGAALRTQQRGRGIPVGSIRSTVRPRGAW